MTKKFTQNGIMVEEPYLLSFTGANLSLSKSLSLARAFDEYGSWEVVEERLLPENILQMRTNSAAVRVHQEIVPRLQTLTEGQMELLIEGSYLEQKHMLWLAVCKRYRYIRDFAIEVIREKYLRMDYQVTDLDYTSFFNRKADWHEELEEITESTENKIRQVLFRMLKEAEILSEDNVIIETILTQKEKRAMMEDAPISFKIFPMILKGENGAGPHE
jgi:hypothetical protein